MASTDLMLETQLIKLVFLGWQFMLAALIGAPSIVIILVFSCFDISSAASYSSRPKRKPIGESPDVWKDTPKWTCRSRTIRPGSG